jgi:hypothetical protein
MGNLHRRLRGIGIAAERVFSRNPRQKKRIRFAKRIGSLFHLIAGDTNTLLRIARTKAAASGFGNRSRPFFRKNLCGETKHVSLGIAPGLARQPGFYAGFLEQPLAGPFPFRGNLGKQKPSEGPSHHHKSMLASNNRVRQNAFRRGQNRDFDIQGSHFFGANWRESRIVQRRVDRGTRHDVGERPGILNLPYAAAQRSGPVEADKRAPALGNCWRESWKIRYALL